MHAIRFIADDELPADHDFVVVSTDAGDQVVFYKQGKVCPRVLEASWDAVRAMETNPPGRLRSAS